MSDEAFDYDEEEYSITPKGLQMILGWIRFQAQMCELEHKELLDAGEECPDQNHMIAILMAFVIVPMMQALESD